ncbi:pentapeptide repeat-containing protein [Streptomyces radicis]|uniref:Pentapeptide repeat-containing protein n=1 Tax=Streptomyces radicis TaxID=1750517 RepID=A0A3A9WAG8_9ACTN|nr:pentapeptide repeat-containing protein [Streptomyces radicis]RKN09709.1 pentapeptide repeat-containing protein [Streptomyces radicis]RKN23347.1 pentapeptide repeat-containing protein [Streptomyces radicis]
MAERDLVKPPRRPDVTLAELRPFDGERLEPSGDYDEVEFDGLDLTDAAAPGASFLDCALRRCVLDAAGMKRARFVDTLLTDVRGVGTALSEASLRDVEIRDARLGGIQLSGATLTRVLIEGGKIDYLNLRQATLTDVTFRDCVLVEPDFAGARLERVSFDGCDLRDVDLTAATCKDTDLRGAVGLSLLRGADRLRGAVITPGQLLDLAPHLAAELGVRVAD